MIFSFLGKVSPQSKQNYMDTPTVLITGALTGIGRATALAFAQEGARVVVSGRHDDEGQKLATELRKLGTEAEFLRTDVRHEEEVKNLVDQTIARFGRLDIAVNNAGTVGNPGWAADVTTENYQGHLRYQCAWYASVHEVRDSGYAPARQRQHR
jgi:NAD(P)-dependent dehydrogenase (short-subunit alcohol dehydrogenase family)